MATRNLTRCALSFLLPAGVFGASMLLAAAQATPVPALARAAIAGNIAPDVAERLASIRRQAGLASTQELATKNVHKYPLLAYWMNFGGFGWRNGGWRNGGWRNWGNGWHNWGNGWHNWGNGWHNYWHNW
jgi:rSAM-associated Gly-rich repeat protein